jgi:hypothetical protein
MQSDASIMQIVQQAFAKRPKPEHFTDYEHCEECAEHDEVLRSRDICSLRIEDVGSPAWDPVCFTNPEGFAYYMPAFVRLALGEPIEPYGWYGSQLLGHLCSDGLRNDRVLACTVAQRRAVVAFLQHVVETRSQLADSYDCTDNLFQAIEYWSGKTEPE